MTPIPDDEPVLGIDTGTGSILSCAKHVDALLPGTVVRNGFPGGYVHFRKEVEESGEEVWRLHNPDTGNSAPASTLYSFTAADLYLPVQVVTRP